MNKLTSEELKELAKDSFVNYPNETVLWGTSNGLFFLNKQKQDAERYCERLKLEAPFKIEKEGVEKAPKAPEAPEATTAPEGATAPEGTTTPEGTTAPEAATALESTTAPEVAKAPAESKKKASASKSTKKNSK